MKYLSINKSMPMPVVESNGICSKRMKVPINDNFTLARTKKKTAKLSTDCCHNLASKTVTKKKLKQLSYIKYKFIKYKYQV